MGTRTAVDTTQAEGSRFRLPPDFIPAHTPEQVRAFVNAQPWGLDRMFAVLPPHFDLTDKSVLDVGCGITLQALELMERYRVGEYHAIDPDRDTFHGGHNNYHDYVPYKHALTFYHPHRLNFYCAVAEKLPFPDDSFDFVMALLTTEHVDDIVATCREIRRVLKPGGYFYATHHNFYAWDGHHQGPYFVADLPHVSQEQMQFQHWRHIEMERDWSEPHHLNRITLRELENAFRDYFRIVVWNNGYTTDARGLTFLTPEILEKYRGRYDYEDLATTNVEILAKNEKGA